VCRVSDAFIVAKCTFGKEERYKERYADDHKRPVFRGENYAFNGELGIGESFSPSSTPKKDPRLNRAAEPASFRGSTEKKIAINGPTCAVAKMPLGIEH
jgi:hypothetical protein